MSVRNHVELVSRGVLRAAVVALSLSVLSLSSGCALETDEDLAEEEWGEADHQLADSPAELEAPEPEDEGDFVQVRVEPDPEPWCPGDGDIVTVASPDDHPTPGTPGGKTGSEGDGSGSHD